MTVWVVGLRMGLLEAGPKVSSVRDAFGFHSKLWIR